MSLLLCEDLSFTDRTYLANMSYHEGYKVLKRLMADACQKATEAVIKLDPTIDGYEKKLAALQQISRAMNEFSSRVLNSVEWHKLEATAIVEQQNQEEKEFVFQNKQL